MKHLGARHSELLETLLRECGLSLSASAQQRMLAHLDWVLEQNRSMNLTAIREPDEAIRLHVVDSLMVLPEVLGSPPGPLVDLGTGAGFPGVPLVLATGREGLLVDSVGKKLRALATFLDSHWEGVRTECIVGRAEELATARPELAGLVVARAVTSLPSLVELAAPLLESHGILVAMKGPLNEDEVARADAVGKILAMHRESTREYTLPRGAERRAVLVYRRTGRSTIALPRRAGMAQRKPLA